MSEEIDFFDRIFYHLKGCKPFNWQRRLFQLFIKGNPPTRVNIPTGCGKTAIMHIWLASLGWQALHDSFPSLPRRLVWIVDRRVVVDQATWEAERIAEELERNENLADLRGALRNLSYSGKTLLISTLRGGRAEDPEWKKDPSTPAILVGTVNMLGSKMLFSGYGDGKWLRPYHAGLLLNDAFIVHDEAHLTPAFYKLLERIRELQAKPLRPLHIMHLSAILREGREDFGLKGEEDEDLRKRVEAKKYLKLHSSSPKEVVEKMVELALEKKEKKKRVLVYVRSPSDAEKNVNQLK
ncbi:MAG: type I-U CRISPR-associated helicase/endonuclease Cas3, partial [Candidatus Hadarchaeales archaeon]